MLSFSFVPFGYQQQENKQQAALCSRVIHRRAQQARIENPADVFPRLSDALGAEDYPADDDKHERQQHL